MLPTINTPDRQAEAFPVLTPAQIARLRPYGNIRSVQAAEVLFEPGKSGMSCFVVLSGKLDIAVSGLSGEQVFVTYGPGQFSGEVVLISGARALSRGRVAEPGEVSRNRRRRVAHVDCEGCRAERYIYARIPPASCRHDFRRPEQCSRAGIATFIQHPAPARIPYPQRPSLSLCRSRQRQSVAGTSGPVRHKDWRTSPL